MLPPEPGKPADLSTEPALMTTQIGRRIQAAIDRLRRKQRLADPADAWGLSSRKVRRLVQPNGALDAIYYGHAGRVAQKWHHYLAIYEQHFEPLRQRKDAVRVLELGVSRGGSLEIWRKYFGPTAKILGIDIDPACSERVDPDNIVMIGDQSDPKLLAAAVERLGGEVDLVIDDGSHLGRHQIASFEYLYPRISADGLYVCEDLHCSYWATHEGGLRREGTFAEYVKTLIDQLQGWYLEGQAQEAAMPFARTTYAIHVYLDVVVIEKRSISRPFHVQMGG
ncbi:MAG: class I SAM-dependent methyltransferase [Hyphomicrobiales bacterium]|nr:class I SAM-dependent methyltransferase [Hyphomicrobiales bacterium]